MIFDYKVKGQVEANTEDQAAARLVELSNDLNPRSIEVGDTTVTLRVIQKQVSFCRECANWSIEGDGRFGFCNLYQFKVSANRMAVACQGKK